MSLLCCNTNMIGLTFACLSFFTDPIASCSTDISKFHKLYIKIYNTQKCFIAFYYLKLISS